MLVEPGQALLTVSSYVDLNPVRAGMTPTPDAIRRYRSDSSRPSRIERSGFMVKSGGIVATLFIYMVSFGLELPKAASWLLIVYFLMGAIAIPPMIWLTATLVLS